MTTPVPPKGIFRAAISDTDGWVDGGYLGMFWVLTVCMGVAVPIMCVGLIVEQVYDPLHKFNALMLGQGLGLAASAFAAACVAVGAFKRLDRASPGTNTSTTVLQKTDTATAPSPQ